MECENPQRQEQESQAVGIPWGNTLKSSAVIALPVWKCLVYYPVGECGNKKVTIQDSINQRQSQQKLLKGKLRGAWCKKSKLPPVLLGQRK